jgi:hypothetical protein
MNIPTPLVVVAAVFVVIVFIGQASHLASRATPPVSFGRGCIILLVQLYTLVLTSVLRLARSVYAPFSFVWVLETLKNLFQALLLSGAGLASEWLPKGAAAPAAATVAGLTLGLPSGWTWETIATIAGFVVIGVLMAVVTKRAETLRDAQAAAAHAELLAKHMDTLQVLADIQRELADLKVTTTQTASDVADVRQKV